MSQAQGVSTQLLMYTRDYCTKQLIRALREPTSQYFQFLYTCALDDAKSDPRKGGMKALVKFQERVNKCNSYAEPKLQMISDAFQKHNTFPLNALVKTILLANAIMIGSFSQDSLIKRDLVVPSDTQFIHALLRNAGKTYFTDPEGALELGGKSKRFDVVTDAIERTLEELIPLEALVQPITEADSFAPHDAREFADQMIEQADGISDGKGIQQAAMSGISPYPSMAGYVPPGTVTAPTFDRDWRPGAAGGPDSDDDDGGDSEDGEDSDDMGFMG